MAETTKPGRKKWRHEALEAPEDAELGIELEATASYILRCGPAPYEVWVRAFDDAAARVLADAPYRLSGPLPDEDEVRSGTTDSKGDLRERDLPCGEYLLEVAGGHCVVAVGVQDEEGAWPDAVRVYDAAPGESDAEEAGGPDEPDLEPGEALPEALWSEGAEAELWLAQPDDIELEPEELEPEPEQG